MKRKERKMKGNKEGRLEKKAEGIWRYEEKEEKD